MKKKTAYRIRNWRGYNRALKQRGSLTVWVSKDATANWTTNDLTGEPGASPTYTNLAIETMATVQAIYSLAGRQTQGFLQSIFELMKIALTVPDHSTLSRRRRRTMFRFKTIFGDRLQTRQVENQFKELLLKTSILNQMTHLGMPDSIKITD